MSAYSPERRTALVLCGTGAHGAYHAGVLRALTEAGVKIDLVAGHGIGAAGAALAAVDGGARLWEADGVWQRSPRRPLYGWTVASRAAAAAVPGVLAVALAALVAAAAGWVGPRPALLAVLAVVALAGAGLWLRGRAAAPRRRAHGAWWWRIVGAPLETASARELFDRVIWDLIRGAAPMERPSRPTLGRRYSETLQEGLGQPGFRELVIVATDLDARRDVVAALLREPFRSDFFAPRPADDRRADVLDLAGVGREHAVDMVAAGLTPPVAADPELVSFAPDSFWRGETHRFCDRAGSVSRLLEEVALAGAAQVIVVTAVAPVTAPHRLRVPRLDVRSRLGEFQAAAETAALRDALEVARLRFDAVYQIAPAHNPIGPFDVAGAYDEASDRHQDVRELMERAYEDAYRQFIEPVVAASGEHLAHAPPAGPLLDTGDSAP